MTAAPHIDLHPDKSTMLAFPVDRILDNSSTDFDLYLELGGRLILYARAPYKWQRDELARLLADGHGLLYHSIKDRQRAEAYAALQKLPRVDPELPPRVKVLALTDAAAELTRVLYEQPLTLATIEAVRGLGAQMVACIEEDRACVSALGRLAHHDHYTYYHSARVAAYALAIAYELSQQDKTQLVEMATGAILHDIGKSKVDLTILNKPGALTPEEWAAMRQHPVFGGEIVEGSSLSFVSRQIIVSHHERFDGTGYPHQLQERELLDEVKIVAFADTFDALTTNRPYQVSRTPYEALDLIRHKLLKNLHKDSYHALVRLLALPEEK